MIKYSNREPIDKDTAIKIVPIHFPKMKPDAKATGEPNPSSKTQITTKKKKIIINTK